MHLDFECKGAYLDLLILQFNRGHMTTHMIGHVLGQRMDTVWPQIKDKFETDGKLYWNDRLKFEKQRRKNYTKSRKNNKLGKNQYSNKEGEVGHMTSHMENETENENTTANEALEIEKEKNDKEQKEMDQFLKEF